MKQENTPNEPFQPEACTECGGRGWMDNRCYTPEQAHRCPQCNGRGLTDLGDSCYACSGTGLMEQRSWDVIACPRCGGAGVYPVPESMTARDYAYRPGSPARKGRRRE